MKKSKSVIALVLGVFIFLFVGYEFGWAEAEEQIRPARIAVVSVNRIFLNSQKHAQWQQEMEKYKQQIEGDLRKLSKEAEAVEADMRTRAAGSSDYLERMRSLTEKRALLEARSKFYEQEMMLKMQRWTEQLYQEILSAAEKVAAKKGIDMVIARRELDFPIEDMNNLMEMVRTNAVLYNDGWLDITDELLSVIDGVAGAGE